MSSNLSSVIKKHPFGKWLLISTMLLLIYVLFVNHAEKYHRFNSGDWQSEFFSDRAGYYIYLPATFICGYYQSAYPDSISYKLGYGFGFEDGKLDTKYTYGVALVTTPFFLITHFNAVISGSKADAFTSEYQHFTYYASVFYLLTGLFALMLFLQRRYSTLASVLSIIVIAFGTNLYYYTFQQALMSHVYSFALFSFLMLLSDNYWRRQSQFTLAGIAFISAVITMIRPTNIIFLPVFILIDVKSIPQLKERIISLLPVRKILVLSGLFLLVWIPQMIYWKFISGNFLYYSYEGEGFTNWLSPKIAAVLFAPRNGLFIYVPAFILIFTGLVVMFFKKETNRWLILFVFLMQLYIVSSWHMFDFGCSFGQRSFIEFLTISGIPLTGLFNRCIRPLKFICLTILSVTSIWLIFYNLRLSDTYAGCFNGRTWDWDLFRHHLTKARVLPLPENTFSWKNNFEESNLYSTSGINIINVNNAFSGYKVNELRGENRFSDGLEFNLAKIATGKIYQVTVSMQLFLKKPIEESYFVCSVNQDDTTLFYSTKRIIMENDQILNKWFKADETFELPFMKPEGKLRIYLMTNKSEDMLIDDFTVIVKSEK